MGFSPPLQIEHAATRRRTNDDSAPAASNSLFTPQNAGDGIDDATSSIIGHVPRADHARWSMALANASGDSLRAAIAVA